MLTLGTSFRLAQSISLVDISFIKERRFSSSSYPIKLGGFSLTAPYKSNHSVFLFSQPIKLGVFSSSDQADFPPQSLTGLGGFLPCYKSKHHRMFERSLRLREKAIVMTAVI